MVLLNFKRTRVVDGSEFKLFGVMGCKKCAMKWKRALQGKNRYVRVNSVKEGWEVWATK